MREKVSNGVEKSGVMMKDEMLRGKNVEEAGKTRRTPGDTGERMESKRRDDDRWQKTEREKKRRRREGGRNGKRRTEENKDGRIREGKRV